MFLHLNGAAVGVDDGAAFTLVMDVAGGHVEVAEIATRLLVADH